MTATPPILRASRDGRRPTGPRSRRRRTGRGPVGRPRHHAWPSTVDHRHPRSPLARRAAAVPARPPRPGGRVGGASHGDRLSGSGRPWVRASKGWAFRRASDREGRPLSSPGLSGLWPERPAPSGLSGQTVPRSRIVARPRPRLQRFRNNATQPRMVRPERPGRPSACLACLGGRGRRSGWPGVRGRRRALRQASPGPGSRPTGSSRGRVHELDDEAELAKGELVESQRGVAEAEQRAAERPRRDRPASGRAAIVRRRGLRRRRGLATASDALLASAPQRRLEGEGLPRRHDRQPRTTWSTSCGSLTQRPMTRAGTWPPPRPISGSPRRRGSDARRRRRGSRRAGGDQVAARR